MATLLFSRPKSAQTEYTQVVSQVSIRSSKRRMCKDPVASNQQLLTSRLQSLGQLSQRVCTPRSTRFAGRSSQAKLCGVMSCLGHGGLALDVAPHIQAGLWWGVVDAVMSCPHALLMNRRTYLSASPSRICPSLKKEIPLKAMLPIQGVLCLLTLNMG